MQYSINAMVKAMKVQDVILKAISGEILWMEAAEELKVRLKKGKARKIAGLVTFLI